MRDNLLDFVPPTERAEVAAQKIKDLAPERMELTADRLLLYAANGDDFLGRVHRAGIEPLTELVRRSTREDAFLYLTGQRIAELLLV